MWEAVPALLALARGDDRIRLVDYTEGRTAFMQKRKPVFTGR